MKKLLVLYTQFYDFDGNVEKIGGIETYIKNLIDVALDLKMEVDIIQFANKNFQKEYKKNVTVYGVYDKKKKNGKKLLQMAYEIGNIENDILLFASSHMNIKNTFKNSLSIQHGIYWDINKVKGKDFPKFISTCLKSLQIFLEIRRNKRVNETICVDYNYINWYRAQTKVTNENLKCIPNFTMIPEDGIKHNGKKIKIIFARRFEYIRGVQILEKALDELLVKYSNIEFTFAGSGTYENYLKEKYSNELRVNFITYKYFESIDIHKEYDIAIVPSIGSEGTSLSLLEAMAAGCSVIATNVGGMTNIIIDGFNGLIINNTSDDLTESLAKLIESKDLRDDLSFNALATVKKSFNIEVWKSKWAKIIKK